MIGGYTEPKGSRTGLGALLLGVHDARSGKLRYAGSVGTGFNEQTLRDLKQRLDAAARVRESRSPMRRRRVKAHWVRPSLVAEVSFGEWTRDGRIRHSVFQGLRADKPAARHHARESRGRGRAPAGQGGAAAPAAAAAHHASRARHRPQQRQ